MKQVKKYFIMILISAVLVNSVNNSNLSIASTASKQTYMSCWVDAGYYLEGETITIGISIWDEDGFAVQEGSIQISDLNGTTFIVTDVTASLNIVTWIATTDGFDGIHQFMISFSPSDSTYLGSTIYKNLLIGYNISPGTSITSMELNTSVLSMIKGQEVTIAGNLVCLKPGFYYFFIMEGTAYISVSLEIMGTTWIIGLIYPSTDTTSQYWFEINFILPSWVSSGQFSTDCHFSGSYPSYLEETTETFTINLLPGEKSIFLTSQENIVERNSMIEDHDLSLEIQVPGFDSDPVMVDIDLLTTNGDFVNNIVNDYQLTNYTTTLQISFDRYTSLGSYLLFANLIDSGTGLSIANDTLEITITDDLLIDNFYWNLTDQRVSSSDLIEGYLISREEDTFTAQITDVAVILESTGSILFQGITDENGYIEFFFTLPEVITAGSHYIDFVVFPLTENLYHQETTKRMTVIFSNPVTINHQEMTVMTRGSNGTFTSTVVDQDGFPIQTGTIKLLFGEIILYESPVDLTNSFEFTVPDDFTLGVNTFTWMYTGSDDGEYDSCSQDFPVTILSVPVFNDVTLNLDEIFPGDTIVVRGSLVDETGIKLVGLSVELGYVNNWGDTYIFNNVSMDDGFFEFSITLESDSTGIHTLLLDFKGLLDDHYLPVSGKYYMQIVVDPLASLIIENDLIAGEESKLHFSGKPEQTILLEIYENSTWYQLGEIYLNDTGTGDFDWIIPGHLKGEVLLRVSYLDHDATSFFTVVVNKCPEIVLIVPEGPLEPGTPIYIQVSSDEQFSILLNGDLWQDSIPSGSFQYELTLNEAGDHLLQVIVSGDYIVETMVEKIIEIRIEYTVTVEMAPRIQKGVDLSLTVSISANDQPIEGFSVEIFANGSLIASGVTSQYGLANLNTSLATGYYEMTVVTTPDTENQNIYVMKNLTIDGGLIVYEVPVIIINDLSPIKGETINVEIIVTSGSEPVENEVIDLYIRNSTDQEDILLGTGSTDDQGIVTILWNVVEEKGEYILKATNTGRDFLESIVVTKAISIVGEGPVILEVTITFVDGKENVYQVTAVIEFSNGEGPVSLYSRQPDILIGTLAQHGTFWVLEFQLSEGTYWLGLKAEDSTGLITWEDLGQKKILSGGINDNGSETSDLGLLIRDTLLSTVILIPIAGYVIFKKKKSIPTLKEQ